MPFLWVIKRNRHYDPRTAGPGGPFRGEAISYPMGLLRRSAPRNDMCRDHTVARAACQSPRTGEVGRGVKRNSDITIVMTSSTESPAIIPAKRSIPGIG